MLVLLCVQDCTQLGIQADLNSCQEVSPYSGSLVTFTFTFQRDKKKNEIEHASNYVYFWTKLAISNSANSFLDQRLTSHV